MDFDDYTLIDVTEPQKSYIPSVGNSRRRFSVSKRKRRKKKIIIALSLVLVLVLIILIANSQSIAWRVKKWNINSQGQSSMVEAASSQLGNSWQTYCDWWGFEGREEWCAVFVCWCADKAGYEADVDYISSRGINSDIGKADDSGAGAGDHARFHEKLGRFYSLESGYIPQSGDLIYFDWDNDNYSEGHLVMDHIGIVEKVEHGIVYTIEGNSKTEGDERDLVRSKNYDIDDTAIRGYSSIEKNDSPQYIK